VDGIDPVPTWFSERNDDGDDACLFLGLRRIEMAVWLVGRTQNLSFAPPSGCLSLETRIR
jgi:hypothetical protein